MNCQRTANEFWEQCQIRPDLHSLAAKGYRITGNMVNRYGPQSGGKWYVDAKGYYCTQSANVTPKMFWEIERIPEPLKHCVCCGRNLPDDCPIAVSTCRPTDFYCQCEECCPRSLEALVEMYGVETVRSAIAKSRRGALPLGDKWTVRLYKAGVPTQVWNVRRKVSRWEDCMAVNAKLVTGVWYRASPGYRLPARFDRQTPPRCRACPCFVM